MKLRKKRRPGNRAPTQAEAARTRWKMWTEMGATMMGQAVASQAVILNPNIPLPEAVKMAESGFQTFMGLAERAFAEAAK